MVDPRNFYINGEWVAPLKALDHAVIDPSTEQPFATISLGSKDDCDRAVAAAKAAFPRWAITPPAERRELVERILDQYEKRKEEMAQAISQEMGAPIDLARNAQAPCLPWHLRNFLTAFDQIEWIRPLGPHAPNDRIAMEPIGVVGLIVGQFGWHAVDHNDIGRVHVALVDHVDRKGHNAGAWAQRRFGDSSDPLDQRQIIPLDRDQIIFHFAVTSRAIGSHHGVMAEAEASA